MHPTINELNEASEVAAGFRDLHKHESELLNHRFQWFALINGLLFAAYGLLWEFKASAQNLMIFIAFFGAFISLSSYMGSRLTNKAHNKITDDYKALCLKYPLLNDLSIRGLDEKTKWDFLLPWNLIFLLFVGFWVAVIAFTRFSPCPKNDTAENIKVEHVSCCKCKKVLSDEEETQ